MDRRVAALVALLLVAPLAQGASWPQYRGTSARDGVAVLPGGALDVGKLHALEGVVLGAYPAGAPIILVDDKPTFVATSDDGCRVVEFDPVSQTSRDAYETDDCSSNSGLAIIAYDEEARMLLLCVGGEVGTSVLRAVSTRDGSEAWGVKPEQTSTDNSVSAFWACSGGAYDTTLHVVYVIFRNFGTAFASGGSYVATSINRLVAVDTRNGDVLWVANIPATTEVLPDGTRVGAGVSSTYDAFGLAGRAVTLTSSGIVVMSVRNVGSAAGAAGQNKFEAVASFFDREGNVQGARSTLREPGTQGFDSLPIRAASWYAVGHGPLAALAFGGRIVLVNPSLGTTIAEQPIVAADPSFEYIWWTTGAWVRDTIVLPLPHSITAFDSTSLQPKWSWSEGLDWGIRDILASADGTLLALVGRPDTDETKIVALDLEEGAPAWELPLPFKVSDSTDGTAWIATAAPIEGRGLFVMDIAGHYVLLAPTLAEDAPRVAMSTRFPAVGEEVELRPAPPPGRVPTRYQVQWGDGTIDVAEANATFRHAYAQPGTRSVRVTAILEDAQTATATATVDVGGTPPPQLTPLQKAFAPEYQNWTFFILGTLITIVGVAVTIGRHRRRFAKLERELAAVEEIRMLSVGDPRGAVLALKSYRDRLPDDLARRRIDDSQYQILDIRSARLLKVLRTRMFSPFDPRLSVRYHRLLDAAFEDAILQTSERDALVAALDSEEALSPGEREEIARILADFTSARHELAH